MKSVFIKTLNYKKKINMFKIPYMDVSLILQNNFLIRYINKTSDSAYRKLNIILLFYDKLK